VGFEHLTFGQTLSWLHTSLRSTFGTAEVSEHRSASEMEHSQQGRCEHQYQRPSDRPGEADHPLCRDTRLSASGSQLNSIPFGTHAHSWYTLYSRQHW
jgi:hypothetical protein